MDRHRKPGDMLASLLMGTYKRFDLQMLMFESMPIAAMPSGTKPSLIKKLIDWMCEVKAEELIYSTVNAFLHRIFFHHPRRKNC